MVKKSYSSFMLIIPCLITVTIFASVNANPSTIHLKIVRSVKNEKKVPVEGVKCYLTSDIGGAGTKKGETNKKGFLKIDNIPPGKYYFRLTSKKFRNSLKDWSLPLFQGPIKVKEKKDSYNFKVVCEKAAKIRGRVSYKGEIDVTKASIFSNSSQFYVHPKKNGKFLYPGVGVRKDIELQVSIRSLKADFSPVYEKVKNIKSEQLKSGSITDIGRIDFPLAKKDERVNVLVVNDKGEKISNGDIRGIKKNLIIENKAGSIRFNASGTQLLSLVKDKKISIRLPKGKYRAFWRGDDEIYNFVVDKGGGETIKITVSK